ncbi:MAG: hypothetical protein BMS9Abin07_1898 [Acidimicrobiia bacterium]|nr:MAG: hypothetical protein BMS9Abin07_1898 [Acidimicrobiia bacterium]
MAALPPMPEDWEDTHATLQAYSNAIAALPRAYITPHDKWWHIALEVKPDGLTTYPFPLPDGSTATVRMDLDSHEVVLETAGGRRWTWPMDAGLTATELGDALIDAASELGLDGECERGKFESDAARPYDATAAAAFYDTLLAVNGVLAEHRARLKGEISPLQLWPHGFDLSFEWFGTRVVELEEDGKMVEYPSQLNLGFYPGGEPYFYSNPWPFDTDDLINNPLPPGSEWYVEDWQGSRLLYRELHNDPKATERLLEFAERVFEVVEPTLTS